MKCWNCQGESNKVVEGPDGLAVCYKCISHTNENNIIDVAGACLFCGRKLGARYGLFRRKIRRVVMIRDAHALCIECLRFMKDIVKEKEEWDS